MSEEEVEKYKQSIADYEEEQTENVYIWQTKIASVNVLNGIEIANYVTEVNKDYLTNWTIRSEGLLQTIESLQNTTLNYKEAAETAQGKAETAQGKAETAQDAAETAQGKAETAQGKAEAAQGKAETAQDAAETAQEASETARDVALGLISTEENNEGAITIAVRNAQTSATQAKINADIAQQLAETANNAKKVVLDLIDDGSKDGEPGAIYLAKEQAIESAGSASDSANVATEAKKAAEAAKGAAETAQGKAEGARDAAEGARDTALGLIDATEGNEGEIILIKKDMEDLKEATDSTYEATAGALEETKEIQAKVEKMQTWFMLVEEF